MHVKQIAVPALAAVLLAACGKSDAPPKPAAPAQSMAGRPLDLPSGRRVTVQGVAPIRFTQGPPALRVVYVTTLDVADTVPLAAEAQEVFERFKPLTERNKLTGFVASATAPPTGMVEQVAKGYNFVWTKGADGQWHRP